MYHDARSSDCHIHFVGVSGFITPTSTVKLISMGIIYSHKKLQNHVLLEPAGS